MAESQEPSDHKAGTFRKSQEKVTPTPELRKEDGYQPYQGNVNPPNGRASKPKPSTNIVHETGSGPGPPTSTQLVPGMPKKVSESTPTCTLQPELIESAKIHYLEDKTFSINSANPSWDGYQTHRCYSSPHSISPNYIMGRLNNNAVNAVNPEYLTIASQTSQTITQSYLGGISIAQSIKNSFVYKTCSILESGERFPEKLVIKTGYGNYKTQDIDIDDASTDTE